MTMNGIGLDRKFTHRVLYKGSELTVRDFLELAAESRSFYISERKEYKSDNLLDDPKTFYVLICEQNSIRLTDEEAEHFAVRRLFWRKWQEEFVKKYFKGSYNDEYIRLENEKKREIPEYLQAISRVGNKVTRFVEYLKNQDIVKKYLYDGCWLSGSSTTVYPITVWDSSKQVVLQWKSDKKIFGKFIERVKKENPGFIIDGKFWKSDGSCPSTITFYYQ